MLKEKICERTVLHPLADQTDFVFPRYPICVTYEFGRTKYSIEGTNVLMAERFACRSLLANTLTKASAQDTRDRLLRGH
jgi:hypothetical protein